MRYFLMAFFLSLAGSCASIDGPSAPVDATPAPPSAPVGAGKGKADIVALAEASACAGKHWGNSVRLSSCVPGSGSVACYTSNRGPIPKAATAGIALVYARALCDSERPEIKAASKKSLGGSEDFLSYGKAAFGALPLGESESGNLRAIYAAMFSFAAMESSGKHCDGKDSAASNQASETCEAGILQTSYNSRAAHSELPKLYASYKAKEKSCFLETFSKGVTCSASAWKNWGSGEGVTFQKLTKECPAFAIEYGAIMMRANRSHYFPLNQAGKPERYPQKWIEPHASCVSMLTEIESLVKASPSVCAELN